MKLREIQSLEESSGYSLQGSFTRDLTASKVWLLQKLAKIAPRVTTAYILGSWFGNLSLYMHLMPLVQAKKIINVDINPAWLTQSRKMLRHIGADNAQHMLSDANDLDYRQLDDSSVVINTSLNNIPGMNWFDSIPTGTLVVLQGRDHDSENAPFESTEQILQRYPLSQVLYQGSLDLQDPETAYTRFMVIGRK